MTSPIQKSPWQGPGGPGTPGAPQAGQGQGPAYTLGQSMYNTGAGLLGQPIAGNGVGKVNMPTMGQFGFGAPPGLPGMGGGPRSPSDMGSGYGIGRNQGMMSGGPRTPQDMGSGYGVPGSSQNPYITGMADDIANRTGQMLGQNNLAIQGNSVASGGLGGSRQGVAQGVAAGQAADYLSGNLSKMYGGLYEGQMDRNLQQYQGDQQFFTQQRGQDLMGAGVGAGLINNGLNTQWQPLQNAANIYGQFSGNGTTTNSSNSGGGWQGILGGLMAGGSFAKNQGWW
jgi:hypothetical protein